LFENYHTPELEAMRAPAVHGGRSPIKADRCTADRGCNSDRVGNFNSRNSRDRRFMAVDGADVHSAPMFLSMISMLFIDRGT
jgi:hypothetical protein